MSGRLADPGAQRADTRNMAPSVRGGKNAGRVPFGQGSGAICETIINRAWGEVPADASGDPCRGGLEISFLPVTTHSFQEQSRFVYFHCQMLADFNTVDEIAWRMLRALEE